MRLLLFLRHRRSYSSVLPLSAYHAQVKDIENLFEKYQLDKIESPEKFLELSRTGAIPTSMAEQLGHERKVQTEARGVSTLIFNHGFLIS